MVAFRGEDPCDFIRFWPQFETEIDQADISHVSKLNYLNSLLRGKASNDIQGLPYSEEGYKRAKEILYENYGKETTVYKQLVLRLQNMPHIRSLQQNQEIN